jgi:uncharacterized protein (DUF1800 family)
LDDHYDLVIDISSAESGVNVNTKSQQIQSTIALYRLGFGASEADLRNAESDPKRWLVDQLDPSHVRAMARDPAFATLPGSDTTGAVFPMLLARAGFAGGMGSGMRRIANLFSSNKTSPSTSSARDNGSDSSTKEAAANAMDKQRPNAVGEPRVNATGEPRMNAMNEPRPGVSGERRAIEQMLPYFTAELEARSRFAAKTLTPFLERLVWFWSNHLTVSAERLGLHPLVGPFEREVVRPHVLGNFKDMLLASLKHPAMQIYLDNFRSVGPNTKAVGTAIGPITRTGVNENLAREVLELHTVGDRGVYSQADVGELALALTGWGLGGRNSKFTFNSDAHEPGARTVLRKRYAQEGMAQAEAIANDLALHPATANHLAKKLLAHFGAGAPSKEDIASVAKAYLDRGGFSTRKSFGATTQPRARSVPMNLWLPLGVRFRLRRPMEKPFAANSNRSGSSRGLRHRRRAGRTRVLPGSGPINYCRASNGAKSSPRSGPHQSMLACSLRARFRRCLANTRNRKSTVPNPALRRWCSFSHRRSFYEHEFEKPFTSSISCFVRGSRRRCPANDPRRPSGERNGREYRALCSHSIAWRT